MIVELTPRIKFVCDRCGKEEFPDERGDIHPHEVMFKEIIPTYITKEGAVCKDCLAEFWELAANFFDEVNKSKGEG